MISKITSANLCKPIYNKLLHFPLAKQSVCQSSGYSDDYVCYVWGLPHVYKGTMFTLHRNRYPTLKYLVTI